MESQPYKLQVFCVWPPQFIRTKKLLITRNFGGKMKLLISALVLLGSVYANADMPFPYTKDDVNAFANSKESSLRIQGPDTGVISNLFNYCEKAGVKKTVVKGSTGYEGTLLSGQSAFYDAIGSAPAYTNYYFSIKNGTGAEDRYNTNSTKHSIWIEGAAAVELLTYMKAAGVVGKTSSSSTFYMDPPTLSPFSTGPGVKCVEDTDATKAVIQTVCQIYLKSK
jgi:hypothetical protein